VDHIVILIMGGWAGPLCHPERSVTEPKDPTNGVHYRPVGSFGYAQDDTVGDDTVVLLNDPPLVSF
jgi:hypothetical protein